MSKSNSRIFQKPYLSVTDQISLVQQRGLIVSDIDKAEHYLQYIMPDRQS